MDSPARVEAPQSFLGITVRRSFVTGRAYLVYGTVMSSLLGIGLGAASPAAFTSGLPLIFPIF
ncbi:MAG TPA: hypothetical protein VEY07_05540, partial [Thermoplasmata archaeon]|nr:hypothetical protein [Thermoplasmata archaeon]